MELAGKGQHTVSEMTEYWKSNNNNNINNNNAAAGGVRYEDSDDEWARKQGFGGFTGHFRGQPERGMCALRNFVSLFGGINNKCVMADIVHF